MKKLLLTALVFSFVGCGADETVYSEVMRAEVKAGFILDQDVKLEMDPELAPVLNLYLSLAPNEGHLKELVELKFGDPGQENYAALCHFSPTKTRYETVRRHVTIRRGVAEGAFLYAVVAHELAHCLHDKEHSPDVDSLMYYKVIDDGVWSDHLVERIQAVFR